jgi:predicted RNA-binding protein with PUA-like domain
LKHKFVVGDSVYFTASNVARPAASGMYEVIRLLPTDGSDCQYRIKSSSEAFERVAKESQLSVC